MIGELEGDSARSKRHREVVRGGLAFLKTMLGMEARASRSEILPCQLIRRQKCVLVNLFR